MTHASPALLGDLQQAIAHSRAGTTPAWPTALNEAVRALGYNPGYTLEHVSLDSKASQLSFHVTTPGQRSHFHTLPVSLLEEQDVTLAIHTHQASQKIHHALARVTSLEDQLRLAQKDVDSARREFWEVLGITPG